MAKAQLNWTPQEKKILRQIGEGDFIWDSGENIAELVTLFVTGMIEADPDSMVFDDQRMACRLRLTSLGQKTLRIFAKTRPCLFCTPPTIGCPTCKGES